MILAPTFPKWQLAAALEAMYRYIQEGKVRSSALSQALPDVVQHSLFFYPSFVGSKSKLGSFRWVLDALHSRDGLSINDVFYDYTTPLIGVKESLYPCVRSQLISRIDLRRAFKQFFRSVSQL